MSSTILVADGDASIRALIKDILEARGYRVETASSAVSAAALMARSSPDLVLAAHGEDDDGGSLVNEAAGAQARHSGHPAYLRLHGKSRPSGPRLRGHGLFAKARGPFPA